MVCDTFWVLSTVKDAVIIARLITSAGAILTVSDYGRNVIVSIMYINCLRVGIIFISQPINLNAISDGRGGNRPQVTIRKDRKGNVRKGRGLHNRQPDWEKGAAPLRTRSRKF